MMRQYETTFILDAHFSHDEMESNIQKYSHLIEKQKGKIKFIDRWGKRRLAYEIDKKQYGYYIYMRFEGEGSIIKSLEKELRMDDQCLRFLTVLVPQSVIQEEKTRPETKPEETSIEMEEKVTPKDSSNDSEERQQPDTPEQSV